VAEEAEAWVAERTAVGQVVAAAKGALEAGVTVVVAVKAEGAVEEAGAEPRAPERAEGATAREGSLAVAPKVVVAMAGAAAVD